MMENEKKKASAAHIRATAKYEKANYDKILLRLPKGTKEEIKLYSDSVNGFISGAVRKALDTAKARRELDAYLESTDPDDLPFH